MTRHIHSLATPQGVRNGTVRSTGRASARCSLLVARPPTRTPELAATEGCYGTPRRRHTVGVSGMSRPIAGVIPSVFLAFATALALPASARADLGLWFTSPRAHWGQRVHVSSPNRYAPFSGVRVYLVPMALARSSRVQRSAGPPHNPRIIQIGALHLYHPGVSRLTFVVPHVPPGYYTIGFLCKPCAPPAGAFFTTAQPGQRWTPHQRRIVRISR